MTNNTLAADSAADHILTADVVNGWVDNYVHAWTTNDGAEIAALFTADAEYHETPYDTDWIGRDEIVDGWQSRWDWQQGGWEFSHSISAIDGMTAVVTGIGTYVKLGTFDNVWTITLDDAGRCSHFQMLNTERD